MKDVIISINKRKQVSVIFCCVLFVGLGVFLFISDDINKGLPPVKFVAILCSLFFGFAVFVGLKQLIRAVYLLKMDNQGLYIHGFLGVCFLWKDIERFFEYTIENQKMIGIKLTNESAYLDSLPSGLQRTCKLNRCLGAPMFSLLPSSSSYKSDELLKLMQEYWDYYSPK